jgi:hypothetical protein
VTTTVLDDHRGLAVHAIRAIAVMAAVIALALLLAHRLDAVPGLLAGAAVGVGDILLLARSLSRFGGRPALNPRALGVGMFTRFLSIGVLLGLILCIRQVNPLAALVGFLLMPSAVAATGARATRRGLTRGAVDAVGS